MGHQSFGILLVLSCVICTQVMVIFILSHQSSCYTIVPPCLVLRLPGSDVSVSCVAVAHSASALKWFFESLCPVKSTQIVLIWLRVCVLNRHYVAGPKRVSWTDHSGGGDRWIAVSLSNANVTFLLCFILCHQSFGIFS